MVELAQLFSGCVPAAAGCISRAHSIQLRTVGCTACNCRAAVQCTDMQPSCSSCRMLTCNGTIFV
jgi:hypothetical protein